MVRWAGGAAGHSDKNKGVGSGLHRLAFLLSSSVMGLIIKVPTPDTALIYVIFIIICTWSLTVSLKG